MNTLFYGLTFDRAVLLLDLDDPGRARLPGGLQGHARLVQALLPEVVGAALGAPPALRSCIKAALRISRLSITDIHILTLSRPRTVGVHFVNLLGAGSMHTPCVRGDHSHAFSTSFMLSHYALRLK